jgi:hypothetical protein
MLTVYLLAATGANSRQFSIMLEIQHLLMYLVLVSIMITYFDQDNGTDHG